MLPLVTLDSYNAQEYHYYICKLQHSLIDEKVHYHKHYQICFVSRGEILHSQENELVHLERGDAFIIPPGFAHKINFVDTNSEIYCLSFEESLFHAGYSQCNAYKFLSMLQSSAISNRGEQVKLRLVFNDRQRKNVRALMECLLSEQEMHYSAELSSSPSIITAILYNLAQSYYQQPQNSAGLKAISAYNTTLSRCTEYIDAHYNEPITMDMLAKRFGLSKSTFFSMFPQFTGLSLKQYIAKKRILEAESLIRSHPDMPLSEIASAVGYNEISTFYRNFIRIVGISPSSYKKLCIKD